MASSEDWARLNCERKIPYAKQKKAEKALSEMQFKLGVGAKHLTVYTCSVCRRYHLGNPKGSKAALKEELTQVLGHEPVSLVKGSLPSAHDDVQRSTGARTDTRHPDQP